MKKLIVTCVVALAAAILVAPAIAQEKAAPKNIKHVVWIGADGFGAHYTNWDELPALKEMKENGSWTLHQRSILPSASALNWETMLVGAPSEMHGFRTWGSKEPDIEPIYKNEHGRYPDIFRVIKDQIPDATTSCVYDWTGIGYLYDKSCVDDDASVENSQQVLENALRQLEAKPTFAFIYFGEPDHLGHDIGWGTPEYQQSLRNVDSYIAAIVAKIKDLGMMEETVIFFNSDHGGSEKGHGEGRLDHMEVPLVVYGCGIEKGEITETVAHFDFAATVAWLFGLERPQAWRGLPTYSITDAK